MNNQKGFTLIEMLVVIAIVGLLSSVVVVGLTGAREKARDARRVADIRGIQNDLEIEYSNASGYPADSGGNAYVIGATGPQGTGDVYKYVSPVGTPADSYTYELTACLEGDEQDTGIGDADGCADQCSGGPRYCVTPQ